MKKYLKNVNFRIFIGNLETLPFSFFLFSVISFSLAHLINSFLEYKFFSIPKPIFNIVETTNIKRTQLNFSLIEELFKNKEKNKEKILVLSKNIKLIGILWIGDKKLALIETENKQKKFLKEGDNLNNSKVIKINTSYIEIEDKEGLKRIYIDLKGKLVNRKYNEVKKFSDNIKEINLKNINLNKDVFSLMKNIIIRPYKKGRKRGLVIERVSDITLAEELGLKEGDIITSIKGMPIINEATFINKLISSVNNGEPIELVILRNGKEEKIRYNGAVFK